MKKIILISAILVSWFSSSQVRMTGIGISASNSSAFIDASSNTTNNGTVGNGKGLVFPRVDLSTFTFVGSTGVPNNYPSRYDGMIVYNTKTGGTANVGTTVGTLAPGFWFYDNKSATTTGGTWKVLGGSASKFTDGTTTPADAVFTGGNVGIGTASPNASAALEVNSTTSGILISRMNSTERDAIASPANALLIFNTSNNTFEVYKSTCSCWVTINDAGNTPASSLVNTPPTASTLNYTGAFRVGGTATIVYTYADAQNDAQGATSIQWEISNDNQGTSKTNLSTGDSATFVAANAGRFVRAKVTPRAATGILNGIDYYGAWTQIDAATVPFGSALSVTGTVAQGSLLTGIYTFNGGSGTENASGSTYVWQSATNNVGLGIQTIALPVGETAYTTTVTPLSTEIGKYIRFGVLAKDNASLTGTNFIYSNWVGPVTLAAEAAPTARNVNFNPASPGTNVTLTASYQYNDANGDPEGASTLKWYTATNYSGAGQTAIAGATANTFTVTSAQANQYIGVGVTPIALTGTTTGTEVVYYSSSASIDAATFTFTGTPISLGNFHSNRVMDATNKIILSINVTSSGSIYFSTNTVNGYSFSAGGTYAIGTYNVELAATGTQTTYNAGGDTFTITGLGTTTQTSTLTIKNVKLGSDFTAHFNGITAGVSSNNLLSTYSSGETFNNNGTCISSPISASACVGSTIVVGGNTYPIANINGQCWMTQNLNELPNGVAVNATQWLATTIGDLGYYGYYNAVTFNGTSGWGTTVPAAGEGLLYQWSAAMLGSTTERAKGVCPSGWHIPSDCEWMYLEHGQGMALSEQVLMNAQRANTTDNQGTPGYKLRSAGTGQTNASGFLGLMAGNRLPAGTFNSRGSVAAWWSSSATAATVAIHRYSFSGNRGVFRNTFAKANGCSVRCLKD
jgi:uncharacterized protein (TIGR02145 family)